MLMLNNSSAAKLVTLALTSLVLTSAAPIINLNSSQDPSLPAIDCIKVQGDLATTAASLAQGDRIPIKIDVSGCDPSTVDPAQPLTITLVKCDQHDTMLKLAEIVGEAEQKEYTWIINTPSTTIEILNLNSASPDSNKYHIKVDAISKDGTTYLTGKTLSFNIDAPVNFQKRDDNNVVSLPPLAEVSNSAIADAVKPEDAALTEVPVPETSAEQAPIASDVTNQVDSVVPDTSMDASPVIPPVDTSNPVPDILPPSTSNVSFEPIDTSDLPMPSGPNQPAQGDPELSNIIQETNRQSASDVFFKYAGASSAILSTIGWGVGGLVGGVLGGTAGLLIGLTAALIDAFK
ncbi:hypothetical protein FBU30_002441 [Linnemannia zychae]|nr:hypothetical protein FBU30_002441 [Linnemannia zychae]